MNTMILALVLAQQQQMEPTAPPWASMLIFIPIFVVFYFLLIRPQVKRQKELDQMQKGLKNGDKVVTAGGIIGTVAGIREEVVVVKVADNVKIDFQRSAITTVVKPKEGGEDQAKK